MQVYILELQGTGEDEYAFENAGVFSTHDLAEERLAEINADYTDADDFVFAIDDNARIEEYKLDA
tara:strand:+ start:439 stop:633 length:195 start_codon:yes stop_codon:yes gene_type:complete